MNKMSKNFRNVNLPRILVNDIEKFIKKPEITHHTIASYIEFAVRQQLQNDKKNLLDQQLVEKSRDYLETIEKAKH